MRPELELIEKIEDFLKGRLSAEEMTAFRKQIAADPELQEKLRLQEDVMKGLERASLTQKVQYAGRNFHYGKTLKKWGWGGAVTAVVVTSTILLFNYWKGQNHSGYEGSLALYNESGKKEFADADRKIASQVFSIDGSRDTVIETKGGITFSIPANGFLDENGKPVKGPVQVSVKEALDAGTIMKSGLSTQSEGRLLETGGMFYIDARTADNILKIDPAKGIYAGVPTDTIKPGMQLFQGKRMADGSIDWVDPKPISHDLTTVDIKSLNFYPPFYLDSLRSWGYDITNKKFTDSLYYSFAAGSISNRIAGKKIFQLLCSSCHAIGKDMTGPNLQGVIDRWGGNMDQIRVWVKNWAKAVAAGYPRAKEVMNFSPSNQTMFDLTDAEIDAVINYANGESKAVATVADSTSVSQTVIIGTDFKRTISWLNFNTCGINPAKIKTIWSQEFQNTFIATREFAERLALIHDQKSPILLDLYVNNLDKNLYELDSMAAEIIGTGEGSYNHNVFLKFAARRDGNVKNNSPQYQKLRDYYQKKTKAYNDVIAKTQIEFWNKQQQLDNNYFQRSDQHRIDSLKRAGENFEEEFTLNLKDAYRQLGYDTGFMNRRVIQPPAQPAYKVVITNTGWCNVDRYVFDATEDRADMTYTDPETGKTTNLKYYPVEFNIINPGHYDQLYVYLLPGKLTSYLKVNGTGGKFSEKLNDLMSYDLVCMGYKGEQPFFYTKKEIKSGSFSVELNPASQSEVDREMQRTGSFSQSSAIIRDVDFLRYEARDRIRQLNNDSLIILQQRIEPLIRCSSVSVGTSITTSQSEYMPKDSITRLLFK